MVQGFRHKASGGIDLRVYIQLSLGVKNVRLWVYIWFDVFLHIIVSVIQTFWIQHREFNYWKKFYNKLDYNWKIFTACVQFVTGLYNIYINLCQYPYISSRLVSRCHFLWNKNTPKDISKIHPYIWVRYTHW